MVADFWRDKIYFADEADHAQISRRRFFFQNCFWRTRNELFFSRTQKSCKVSFLFSSLISKTNSDTVSALLDWQKTANPTFQKLATKVQVKIRQRSRAGRLERGSRKTPTFQKVFFKSAFELFESFFLFLEKSRARPLYNVTLEWKAPKETGGSSIVEFKVQQRYANQNQSVWELKYKGLNYSQNNYFNQKIRNRNKSCFHRSSSWFQNRVSRPSREPARNGVGLVSSRNDQHAAGAPSGAEKDRRS